MRVIAVTGATGFIGRALVKSLCARNDTVVHVLTREGVSPLGVDHQNLNVFTGDLLKQSSIENFLEQGCTVVNLAFVSSGTSADNLLAVNNLIDASLRRNVKRVIHCSTAVVVGKASERVVTEKTSCRPSNAYEITKYEIERLFLNAAPKAFELGVLRPTAVFGPGGKNLIKLADSLVRGQRTLNGLKSCLSGARRMHLVCLGNVVSALCFLIDYRSVLRRDTFIISDDEDPANNYQDIETVVAHELGVSQSLLTKWSLPPFVLTTLLLLMGKSNIDLSRIYSSQKLREAGFEKAVSLEQGLLEFTDWFGRQLNLPLER